MGGAAPLLLAALALCNVSSYLYLSILHCKELEA